MSAITHGGSGSAYTNRRCRCDLCREANTRRVNRRRAERWALRTLVDGRLVIPPMRGGPQHGTYSSYNNWGCHCEHCTAAAQRARRASTRAAS